MKFALFGNKHQSKKSENIDKLFAAISDWKDSFYIDRPFYEHLLEEDKLSVQPEGIIDGDDFDADIAISFGGDGTFLRTANRVGSKNIPLLGINAGRLGFLTSFSANNIPELFAYLHNGEYSIEERGVIQVSAADRELTSNPYALNEVAVMKHDNSSMISIEASLNNKEFITYQADGLIMSAPSGSTGYSLSAGGPIIAPDANVFVLTPIASHSLNARPVVVNDHTEVKLKVASRSHNYLIAIDGRNVECDEETILTLRKADHTIKIVQIEGQTFFKTLRDKMMWGADLRN
jgi:NAD+ kinase